MREIIPHHGDRRALDTLEGYSGQFVHQSFTIATLHIGLQVLGASVLRKLDAGFVNLLRKHRPLLCPCLNEGRWCRPWFRRRCRAQRAGGHIHLGEIAGRKPIP
jgi:hypothetical protein